MQSNIPAKRVFKTPIVVPFSIIMVVVIYAGYIYVSATGEESEFLSYLKNISFQVFFLCELGMVCLIFYNKKQLEDFWCRFSSIDSRHSLECLKPIVRTNMYSSLFMLVFLGLGSLTAIMSILNFGLIKSVVVGVLSVVTAILIQWYNPSEQKIKHIKCSNESLAQELDDILQCWMHKPLPNF